MDVNGDGLPDVVIIYRIGDSPLLFHVFLNNGDGTYEDLPSVLLVGDPMGSDTISQQSIVRMADLNGDGLPDLVVLNTSGIHVCLRSGDIGNGGWTSCQTVTFAQLGWPDPSICQMPPGAPFVDWTWMQIADVDGTDIPRVLVFSYCNNNSGARHFASLLVAPNGPRPGLLSDITAIGGLSTHITYGVSTDPQLGITPAIPVPVWLVTTITASNNLTGTQARTLTTDYEYQQPVYDPRQREFVGFRVVFEGYAGANGAPGLTRKTTFINEACGTQATCENRPDYSYYEGLRDLPVLIEESDAATGSRLRTTVNRYQLNWTYATTMGGRLVLLEWLYQQDIYLWDQQSSISTTFYPTSLSDAGPTLTVELPISGSDLRHRSYLDGFGNETASVDFGKLGSDQPILVNRVWQLPPGDKTGWNYRETSIQTSYSDPTGLNSSGSIREYIYTYDPIGRLSSATGALSGTRILPRSNPAGSTAPTPSDASDTAPHNVMLATFSYDTLGNIQSVVTPGNRCIGFDYDVLFNQLPYHQYTYVAGCMSSSPLTASVAYDRGFALPTKVYSPANELTQRSYDAFGRLIEEDQPSAIAYGVTAPTPAIRVHYLNDTGPIRVVDTQTVDGDEQAAFLIDHYRYVDAFGDTLATVDRGGSQSDNKSTWIISNVHTRYPNGLLARVNKPSYFYGDISGFQPASYVPGTPSRSLTYDSLARVLSGTDYKGGLTTFTYHPAALAVDIRDPEQTAGEHTGAMTTLFADGHGRRTKIDQHFTNGPLGESGDLLTTAKYQASGEPTTITISHAASVLYTRSMIYDFTGPLGV